jgi:hypothetical protein
MAYSDEKVENLDPKPLGTKLDSGTNYNSAEGFWIYLSFKDQFLSRRAKP